MSPLTRRDLVRGALSFGLAVGATSLLAACGGAASPAQPPAAAPTAAQPTPAPAQPAAAAPTPAPQAAAPTGATQIEIGSYFDSGPRLDFINKVLGQFKQDNPAIQVKFEPVPSAQYWDKMQVRLASNTAPDILIGSGSTFLNFAEKGAWGQVDGYLKTDKSFNLDNYYKQADIFAWQGKQYGLPFMENVTLYAYNKNLFQAAGVDAPNDNWTWDDLVEKGLKLTKPGQFGLYVSDGFEFNWITYIWSNDGEYISKDLTKTTLEMPETQAAFQWLVDLKLKHKIAPAEGDTTLGQGDAFMTGKVAMIATATGSTGNWLNGIKNFEWDYFYVPAHPKTGKRALSSNGNPYLLIQQSKHPDQAWLLLKHLASPFTQGLIAQMKIAMPTLISMATDPKGYLAPPPDHLNVADRHMKISRDLQFHKTWLQWYNEITKQMVVAFSGEKTVAEATKIADASGDRILKS